MPRQLQFRRLFWLALLLGAAFAGLGYRLVDLQVLRHEDLSARAQTETRKEMLLQPRRGDILDAKGNPLATSVLVKDVCIDPTAMGNRQVEVARVLTNWLHIPEAEVLRRMRLELRKNDKGEVYTNKFVLLKKKVPVETWDGLHAAMTNLNFGLQEKKLPKTEQAFYDYLRHKAVFARDSQLRTYPNQSLAAHVLGYVSEEEREVNEFPFPFTELRGQDGIEQKFDTQLAGIRGWRRTEADSRKRELVTLRDQDVQPRDGMNVVLTIDSVIQHTVETALADAMEKYTPISISGIVVRPRTGEVLAMATLPNYDPNNLNHSTPDTRRNRVITDVAEPGSTFKIVVVSGALNEGVARLNDRFDCEHGHFVFAGRTLHDHEPYGVLSVSEIIAHSSNIGAAKVGIQLGEDRLYNYIRDFGFGTETGIPLLGEVVGRVYSLKKWSKVSIAQIPMGQGLSVTRLQMTMAMCAIANHGVLMRPMLVDRLEDREHNLVAQYSPQRVRQVIGDAAAREMVTALKVVATTNGTAPKAALKHYTVAGKTGTAQKVENGVYVHNKFFASFIGFFPADNPEVCISITMDEPDVHKGYYGGQAAAPVFAQIAERVASYLNIPAENGDGSATPDKIAGLTEPRPVRSISNRTP